MAVNDKSLYVFDQRYLAINVILSGGFGRKIHSSSYTPMYRT